MNDSDRRSQSHVLAILPGFTASTLMNVVGPLLDLERAGKISLEVTLEFYTLQSSLEKADLVVFCRNTDPRYAWLLETIERSRLPYIYDLDDNLFEIPLNTPLGQYYRTPEQAAMLTHYIERAALVRVYSQPLVERVRPLNPCLELVAAPLDWKLISEKARPQENGPLKIVYVTSRDVDPLAEIFIPALQKILAEYGPRVQMHFMGCLPAAMRGFSGVHFTRFRHNYQDFMRSFSRQGFAIGLAPLVDDVFHRSKTNNKFREYAACSIAGIYSNVDIYSNSVVNGKTGLLIENTPDAWYAAMKTLIEDGQLRQQISTEARARVRQLYSQEQFCNKWDQHIRQVLSEKPAASFVPAAGAAGPAPAAPRTGDLKLRGKIRQAWRQLKTRGPVQILQTLSLQARNLWFLYKINRLKGL